MPELPEVERAAKLLRSKAVGKTVTQVDTTEDAIVFAGITHTEFASELTGRTVTKASRYGKVFYLELDGDGKFPVLHFGMTGMLQVKGEEAIIYGDTLNKKPTKVWPPKFMKFILHLSDPNAAPTSEPTLIAFMDPRRLGRIRLCASPLKEPPISELGFDPILSMPTLEAFHDIVRKRKCPIKNLLLDQSFSAGVGNWVADEVLYHARVHPLHRCNELDGSQIAALHEQIKNVCTIAVSVDAEASQFPENWLFKHRWGKGKRGHNLKLPSGQLATIKFITIGGRTAAYVEELQRLSNSTIAEDADNNGAETDSTLTSLSDSEAGAAQTRSPKKRKPPPTKTPNKKRSKRAKK